MLEDNFSVVRQSVRKRGGLGNRFKFDSHGVGKIDTELGKEI